MKKVLQILLIFILYSVMFMITFHLPIRNTVNVYTYYGFKVLIVFTIILCFILFFCIKKKILNFDKKDFVITVLICFFVNAFVFGMVVITMERSISVFMINEMSKSDSNTKSQIEDSFISNYVYEKNAFGKRFEEQIEINNIKENNQEYSLSFKGKLILKCFKLINKIYNVKSNLLN